MVDGQLNPRIELEAARMAVRWKALFATELQLVARKLAVDSDFVTVEHFRQALPTATSNIMSMIDKEFIEATYDQQRAA